MNDERECRTNDDSEGDVSGDHDWNPGEKGKSGRMRVQGCSKWGRHCVLRHNLGKKCERHAQIGRAAGSTVSGLGNFTHRKTGWQKQVLRQEP